jgi:hypothetical protein
MNGPDIVAIPSRTPDGAPEVRLEITIGDSQFRQVLTPAEALRAAEDLILAADRANATTRAGA